jgi:hypothetical protein
VIGANSLRIACHVSCLVFLCWRLGGNVLSAQRQADGSGQTRPSSASSGMAPPQQSGQSTMVQSSSFGLFNQLREGAASIVKNVKDASAKVVETVSM